MILGSTVIQSRLDYITKYIIHNTWLYTTLFT